MPGKAFSSSSLAVLRSSLSAFFPDEALSAGRVLASAIEGAANARTSATAMMRSSLSMIPPGRVDQSWVLPNTRSGDSERPGSVILRPRERLLVRFHLGGIPLREFHRGARRIFRAPIGAQEDGSVRARMQAREHLPALLPVELQIAGVLRQPVAIDLPFLGLVLADERADLPDPGCGHARPGVALQAADGRRLHAGAFAVRRPPASQIHGAGPRFLQLHQAPATPLPEKKREPHPAQGAGALEPVGDV